MTEYINKAELLRETICKGILCSECSFNDNVKDARCKLIRYINELLTIDIVHCSECVWFNEGYTICKMGNINGGNKAYFCAEGERRTE